MTLDDMPTPLYETNSFLKKGFFGIKRRLCLVCFNDFAISCLVSTRSEEVVPLCKKCSLEWNIYGYNILIKLKDQNPWHLFKKIFDFKKDKYFFSPSFYSIYKDVTTFLKWYKRMKRWIK